MIRSIHFLTYFRHMLYTLYKYVIYRMGWHRFVGKWFWISKADVDVLPSLIMNTVLLYAPETLHSATGSATGHFLWWNRSIRRRQRIFLFPVASYSICLHLFRCEYNDTWNYLLLFPGYDYKNTKILYRLKSLSCLDAEKVSNLSFKFPGCSYNVQNV